MKISILIVLILCANTFCYSQASRLKYVIYDFDGLSIGQTDLPDGDYKNNDLNYQIVPTPLLNSDMLGDRVAELDITWAAGVGEFGKTLARFIDLDKDQDRLNFYFYNPLSNGDDSIMEILITEDDNSNNIYEYNDDDKWLDTIVIHRSSGWQLVSIPLNDFKDANPGGNGIFDAGYAGTGSMLFSVGFIFRRTSSASSEQYFMDMISFSEGSLPTGSSIFDLPLKDPSDYCHLGAIANNQYPESTPDTINALFSNSQLTYTNWFLAYSKSGTVANAYPGNEIQSMLANGYTPIITWEMMYEGYSRLDPVQPRLDQILDGSFDIYIDAFADQVKSYNQTIIMRIFHEFDGNWYSWSLSENNSDPGKYISAYRHIVDRFRARGASNVQWMWCVNAEPKPYVDYNWIVESYPGDDYVDIVATDIYNHPDYGVPFWKSFRYTLSETYYYLTKYFPSKPLYVCEVACRERYSVEIPTSQTKADWLCEMAKELQSNFSKVRALVFFSILKEHDWRLNSSTQALDAINSCLWNNSFFSGIEENDKVQLLDAYPNPFWNDITIDLKSLSVYPDNYELNIYNLLGENILNYGAVHPGEEIHVGADLAAGVYIIELKSEKSAKMIKVVKATGRPF